MSSSAFNLGVESLAQNVDTEMPDAPVYSDGDAGRRDGALTFPGRDDQAFLVINTGTPTVQYIYQPHYPNPREMVVTTVVISSWTHECEPAVDGDDYILVGAPGYKCKVCGATGD